MFDMIKNKHCNHELGAPVSWDEKRDGKCGVLPCHTDGRQYMSWWRPSAEDIANMVAGYPIRLVVVGRFHPPVSLDVDLENDDAGVNVEGGG